MYHSVDLLFNYPPWVTKGIADVLKSRQEAFRRGSTEDVKRLQKEARKEILENKKKFRHKVEDSFASNNSRQLWSSLQTMTGYNPNKKSLVADDPRKLAHDLNCFYARFDSTDFSAERAATLAEANRMEQREEVLTEEEVSRRFRLVSQRSACGPDEIPGAVLKHCHDSLASVFTTLFQRSLESGHIPSIWKSSNVVPVPKKPSPSALNDYRPIALTSIPFKCMERIVLKRLLVATQSFQDPLQFAYTPNRNTEDAILTVTHAVLKHLEKPKASARMLFLDFSSAFNTIQPHLLIRKLMVMDTNPVIIRWLCSFLTDRPQRVVVRSSTTLEVSSEVCTNTGLLFSDSGAPALFTLYTPDCQCTAKASIISALLFSVFCCSILYTRCYCYSGCWTENVLLLSVLAWVLIL